MLSERPLIQLAYAVELVISVLKNGVYILAVDHSLPSPLMKEEPQPTQQTQPKGIDPKTGKPYEPVEIPVPKRSTFDRLLHRAENTPPDETGR